MAGWIADLSYGHDSVTGATLKARGCVGVIAYAGCTDSGKNATKANIADWEAHGLTVYLVIENKTDDLHDAAHGTAQGNAILNAAKALGYDYARKPLFTGFDTNAGSSNYAGILAGFSAFANVVPHGGYYGDSDSIRYLYEHGHTSAFFWQSESGSFSPEHSSPFAHLQQNFNDSRAAGLPVDANDILKPLTTVEDDVSAADVIAALEKGGVLADVATLRDRTINPQYQKLHDMIANSHAQQMAAFAGLQKTVGQLGGTVDVPALADALAGDLGPDLVKQLLDALSARLAA